MASALLVRATEVLARRGHSQVALRVSQDNAPAIQLYRGLGFTDRMDTESKPQRTSSHAVVVEAACPNAAVVEQFLRSLPEWFGIETAIADYVGAAGHMETFFAWAHGDRREGPVGAVLLQRHFPTAAEAYLMAVDRGWHRRGVGRRLIDKVEHTLRSEGAALLSVKTLGPSHPDVGYAITRGFYVAMGFLPVEEIHDLWPVNPCLLMVKPL